MSKKIILILLIFSFNYGFTQLNQQSKKITQKFFSDLNELENITPALQKKKGFTNYKELLEYIDNKIIQHPEIISKKYIGESQKGYKIPMVYLSNKNNNKNKIKAEYQARVLARKQDSTDAANKYLARKGRQSGTLTEQDAVEAQRVGDRAALSSGLRANEYEYIPDP